MRGYVCIVVVLCGFSTIVLAQQQSAPASGKRVEQPDVHTVLSRAGEYVEAYERQLGGMVAEEHHLQTFSTTGDWIMGYKSRRTMKSDLLLVRPHGADLWVQFRDVFEVDGKPVRDRTDRLAMLFLQPSSATASQVVHIAAESSRYNLGDIKRTINVPVMPLVVLEPRNQGRFTFKRASGTTIQLHGIGRDRILGIEVPSFGEPVRFSSDGTWVIEYEERAAHTIVKNGSGGDLPIRGRFWIDPSTGRVLIAEMIVDDRAMHLVLDVSYQSQPIPGLLAPIEMRELIARLVRPVSVTTGIATYSNIRQFQVKVDEKFAPIKDRLQRY